MLHRHTPLLLSLLAIQEQQQGALAASTRMRYPNQSLQNDATKASISNIQKSSEQRDLQQNIFVIIRGSESEEETPFPTPSPTPQPEKRAIGNFRSCVTENNEEEPGEDGDAATTGVISSQTVRFTYNVELSDVEITDEEEQVIVDALTTSMVDSIYETQCQRRRLSSSSLASYSSFTSSLQRSLQVQAISPGTSDLYVDDCVPQSADSIGCRRYAGSIVVGYDDDGDDETRTTVEEEVLNRITEDMSTDLYLDSVNVNLEDVGSDVNVTSVVYDGTSYFDIPPPPAAESVDNGPSVAGLNTISYTVEESGLSVFGKATVPIMSLMSIGMCIALYFMYRSRSEAKREKDILDIIQEAENDELHLESAFDDGDDDGMVIINDDESSYASFKPKDLALHHTHMDVMKCNKINCLACKEWNDKNIGGRINSASPVNTGAAAATSARSPYDQSIEATLNDIPKPENPEELDTVFCTQADEPEPTRGFFGFGRRKKKPEPTFSHVQLMTSNEDDDDNNDGLEPTTNIFQDEPSTGSSGAGLKSINFIKIGPPGVDQDEVDEILFGKKRSFVDEEGTLRNEVEL